MNTIERIEAEMKLRKMEKVADVQRITAEMKRVGMEKFAEIFSNTMAKEEYVFNPEEFFCGTSPDPKFLEVYAKHLREFHLAVYREYLPFANAQTFAENFGFFGEGDDVPKSKIYEALSSVPSTDK